MPVTPFHLGPGVLAKAVAPGAVSFVAFTVANVAIDLESVVNLVLGRSPVHATLHTLGGALAVGALAGWAVGAFGRWRGWTSAEWRPRPALAGGVLGGLSQTALDAVMHADLAPLAPVTDANPLLRIVGLDTLHLACVAAGGLGLVGLWLRQWSAP